MLVARANGVFLLPWTPAADLDSVRGAHCLCTRCRSGGSCPLSPEHVCAGLRLLCTFLELSAATARLSHNTFGIFWLYFRNLLMRVPRVMLSDLAALMVAMFMLRRFAIQSMTHSVAASRRVKLLSSLFLQAWRRRSGQTPTFGTGPSMAFEGDWYIYLEAVEPWASGMKTCTSRLLRSVDLGALSVDFFDQQSRTVGFCPVRHGCRQAMPLACLRLSCYSPYREPCISSFLPDAVADGLKSDPCGLPTLEASGGNHPYKAGYWMKSRDDQQSPVSKSKEKPPPPNEQMYVLPTKR